MYPKIPGVPFVTAHLEENGPIRPTEKNKKHKPPDSEAWKTTKKHETG